jgi:hypothetical protein
MRTARRHWRLWPLVALTVLVAAGLAPAAPAGAVTQKTVTVKVVPTLAGVQFTIDGQTGVTDATGQATVADPQLAGVSQRLVLPAQQISPTARVSLDRLTNNPNHGPFTRLLIVELDVDQMVGVRFTTPQGLPYPAGHVTRAVVRDNLGRTLQWTGAQLNKPFWLASTRPVRVTSGIKDHTVVYALQAVMVDGSSVVHAGQQRFSPSDTSIWDIGVTLYPLTVSGNDFLSGNPVGKTATLTYPNKRTLVGPLGPNHKVTFADLPPGDYQVKVSGGIIGTPAAVHLSQPSSVVCVVVTPRDALVLLGVGVLIVAVLVWAGVVGRRWRRRRAAGTDQETEPSEPVDGPHGAEDPGRAVPDAIAAGPDDRPMERDVVTHAR